MSPLIEPDVAERVLRTALRAGGAFAELFAEDERSMAAALDEGGVEEVTSGRDRGAGVRVVAGGTTGFAHTADLTERGLRAAAQVAAEVAGSGGGPVPAVRLTSEATTRRPGRAPAAVGPEDVPKDAAKAAKVALLATAADAAHGASGAVSQVLARYGANRRHILVANSDGVLVEDEQVRTVFSVACIATRDGETASGDQGVGYSGGFELFDGDDVAVTARRAARQAVAKLGAEPAPSGSLPVVFGGGGGGVLLHEACGHGLEADLVARGASVFADLRGSRVASPLLTLADDATLARGWGSFAIDDEGLPARRTVLIENGVLSDYLYDRLRARRAGRAGSGNGRRESYQHLPLVRMTNVVAEASGVSRDDIIADTARGIYVVQLDAGEVNTATGAFVFGITEAYAIERGEITRPLREGSVVGDSLEVLRHIDAVGDDVGMGAPATCDKDAQRVPVGDAVPTLRVASMTVSGTVR